MLDFLPTLTDLAIAALIVLAAGVGAGMAIGLSL